MRSATYANIFLTRNILLAFRREFLGTVRRVKEQRGADIPIGAGNAR